MFRRIESTDQAPMTFTFNGMPVKAHEGDSVAAALLASQHKVFRRTPKLKRERGPLCMMGVCFECLVTIDGVSNIQACLTSVKPGMVVEEQAAPSAKTTADFR